MHFSKISFKPVFILGLFLLWPLIFFAQRVLEIKIPNMEITADRLELGDGDTFGLGDWQTFVKIRLEGTTLFLDGRIIFSEKANDFTTITGEIHQQIEVPALKNCSFCTVSIENLTGSAGGDNIGARGFQWFDGRGIIRRAKIRTDTFGEDTGQIGGILQFQPIRAVIRCDYAFFE